MNQVLNLTTMDWITSQNIDLSRFSQETIEIDATIVAQVPTKPTSIQVFDPEEDDHLSICIRWNRSQP